MVLLEEEGFGLRVLQLVERVVSDSILQRVERGRRMLAGLARLYGRSRVRRLELGLNGRSRVLLIELFPVHLDVEVRLDFPRNRLVILAIREMHVQGSGTWNSLTENKVY